MLLPGISVSALWPATVIESQVTEVMQVPRSHMRKSTIFADATINILNEKNRKVGNMNFLNFCVSNGRNQRELAMSVITSQVNMLCLCR